MSSFCARWIETSLCYFLDKYGFYHAVCFVMLFNVPQMKPCIKNTVALIKPQVKNERLEVLELLIFIFLIVTPFAICILGRNVD